MREVGRILLLKISRHPEECNDEGSSKVFEWGEASPLIAAPSLPALHANRLSMGLTSPSLTGAQTPPRNAPALSLQITLQTVACKMKEFVTC